MSRQIFVNLPVKDLAKSMKFYEAVGFKNNPQFTDATGACMVLSDDIFVMLLTHEKFKPFTPKQIADATKTTEVLVALSQDSRAEVDRIVAAAVANGGTTYTEPKDHGFMYQHGYQDPDGHIFEIFWMDPAALQK
jgi:predicted lactoylglutathione lyase